MNPVVASVLLSAIERKLETESIGPNERERLLEVQSFAEANLPMLLPTDDDLGPEQFASRQFTIEDLADEISPLEGHGSISRWAIGVTTAPRRQPTLTHCLASLAAAGWSDPHLFIDGDVEVPPTFQQLHITRRIPAIGAWPNYHLSLWELMLREPEADAYLIVQDDARFPDAPVRKYLEQIFWRGSGNEMEVLSLYCCQDDQELKAGWSLYQDRWRYGAVAIVFSRTAAAGFVRSPEALQHGQQEAAKRLVGIDDVIGRWLEREGIRIWRSTPSIVEHIGEVSTLWATARAVGVRAAGRSLVSQPRTR